MKIFYFTGTGNCLQIARGVGVGGELVSIPQFLREHKDQQGKVIIKDETIGLVFPTYWCAMPQNVTDFLHKVRFETEYLFAITTRGNASFTLKSQLLQVARQNGHTVSYFNTVTMPDNYLPSFNMKKQKLRYDEEALIKSMKTMAADIRARKHRGNGLAGLTFLRPFLIRHAEKTMADFSRHFLVNESCNGCSTCTKVCSAQSIELIDDTPVFGGACNGCLACVQNCPCNAIHMRVEKSSERYRNPTVSLADIISANS